MTYLLLAPHDIFITIMIKNIIIIGIVFATISCINNDKKTSPNINLEGCRWDVSESLGVVYGIYAFNNYLVVHNNIGETELTLFDIHKKSPLLNFGHRGRGPGEVFNSKPIFTTDNSVNVYVNTKKAVVSFDFSNISNLKVSEKSAGDNNDRYISMCMVSDSTYLATGIFPSKKRFSIFDSIDVIHLGNYSENKLIDESMPFNIVGSAYKRNGNKFAAANIYGKKIHIYNYDTANKTIDEICVVGAEEPHFIINKYSGYPNFGADEKTIWGYLNLACDDDYIYAHYSGKPQQTHTSYLKNNSIEVYDWDGKLQCTITLDQDVSYVTIVANVIYAIIETPNGEYDIMEYNIPNTKYLK